MERILELALRQAQAAEVFTVNDEEIPVEFEAGKLKHIQSKQSTVIALRIIKNGRIGYGVTTELDEIQKLVDMAVETAEFGMEAPFDLPSAQEYTAVKSYDPAIEHVTIEQMVSLGQKMIDAVTSFNPEVLCDAGASRQTGTVSIINSSGLRAECRSSLFSLGLGGNLIRGTDMLFVGDGQSSSCPIASPDEVINNVLRQLEWAKDQAPVNTKSMPVIFTPMGVESALIAPIISAFNGKMVLEGASPLKDKLGSQVFHESLNINDDSTMDYQPASSPFDDEGVATRSTPLVAGGVAMNFYYDLYTAALAGTSSTGNANRSGGGLPSPGINALTIKPGHTSLEDMIADIKEGLLIEHVMGAGQGNILGGEFSGNVLLGYKIENGKIQGRIKNTMVYGNIYKLLGDHMAAIGSDGRWVGGSLYTPSLYCHEIAVSAK